MKLIIQIPCYNEFDTLALVLSGLPKQIDGIDAIETLVIDDGSKDGTSEKARSLGVTHIVRHTRNRGLAATFRTGINASLQMGADIIVNIDGDNQFRGSDIPALIQPILLKTSDIVIGSRDTDTILEFSPLKKFLQRLGSNVVRRLSGTAIRDTVSGLRAFSRDAAIRLTILSNYTYTLESILQVGAKGFQITDIPVQTNPKTRESRLMSSIGSYLAFSISTMLRVFTMYNPLRVFLTLGLLLVSLGSLLAFRFLYFYFTTGGAGRIQSLIFAAIFFLSGVSVILVGLLADLIQFNRRLLEDALERIKRLELR